MFIKIFNLKKNEILFSRHFDRCGKVEDVACVTNQQEQLVGLVEVVEATAMRVAAAAVATQAAVAP